MRTAVLLASLFAWRVLAGPAAATTADVSPAAPPLAPPAAAVLTPAPMDPASSNTASSNTASSNTASSNTPSSNTASAPSSAASTAAAPAPGPPAASADVDADVDAVAPPLTAGDVVQPMLKTVVALSIVLLLVWLTLHKGMGRLLEKAQAGKRLKVVERVALDARRSLFLVEVDGRTLVVGGGDLVRLDGVGGSTLAAGAADDADAATTARAATFGKVLAGTPARATTASPSLSPALSTAPSTAPSTSPPAATASFATTTTEPA
jgi:flagellar protein FliO/FliZ